MLVSGLLNYDRVVLIFVSSRVNIKLSVSSLDKMRALINLQCNRSWHWFPLCYLDPPLINVYKFLVCGVVVWAGRSGGIGVAGGAAPKLKRSATWRTVIGWMWVGKRVQYAVIMSIPYRETGPVLSWTAWFQIYPLLCLSYPLLGLGYHLQSGRRCLLGWLGGEDWNLQSWMRGWFSSTCIS